MDDEITRPERPYYAMARWIDYIKSLDKNISLWPHIMFLCGDVARIYGDHYDKNIPLEILPESIQVTAMPKLIEEGYKIISNPKLELKEFSNEELINELKERLNNE